jgi:hypothetical protein
MASPFKLYHWSQHIFSASLFILATVSASSFFAVGQGVLFGKEAGWKSLLYMPFLMALGVGVSLNNAKAVFEAIWSAIRRKPSEFVRTIKYGATTGAKHRTYRAQRVFTFTRLTIPILEIAFGIYMACCIYIALRWGFGLASVPFLVIFASGYFYVGLNSIHVLWKMNREAEEIAAAAEPVST